MQDLIAKGVTMDTSEILYKSETIANLVIAMETPIFMLPIGVITVPENAYNVWVTPLVGVVTNVKWVTMEILYLVNAKLVIATNTDLCLLNVIQ